MIEQSELFKKAISKTHQGSFRQAQQLFCILVKKYPNKYNYLVNLGTVNYQLNSIQQAIQIFTKCISIDPFAFPAYYNRFLCFYESKSFIQAANDMRRALSCIHSQIGYKKKNINILTQAINLIPNNVKAYLYRAQTYQAINNKQLAEKDYNQAIKIGVFLKQSYCLRANFYRKESRIQQFEKDAKQMLTLLQKQNQNHFQLIQYFKPNANKKQIIQKIKQYVNNLENIRSSMKLIQGNYIKQEQKQQIQVKDCNDKRYQNLSGSQQKQQDIQNSQYLNQEINKVQEQIKKYGGKLQISQASDQKDLSDDFIKSEIPKALNALEYQQKKKNVETSLIQQLNKSYQSSPQKSHFEVEYLYDYSKFSLIIISAEIFLKEGANYTNFIVTADYNSGSYTTSPASLQWNEKFDHDIHFKIKPQIYIWVYGKSRFQSDFCFGKGKISLLQKKSNQCSLFIKNKKAGILKYELQLLK